MNIYKLTQTVNKRYDTYDSCIVAAETEELAVRVMPYEEDKDMKSFYLCDGCYTEESYQEMMGWCSSNHINCEYIGLAKDSQKEGLILASFNAG